MEDTEGARFVALCYKFQNENNNRYLFCKIHNADSESTVKPSDRTLLVLNVPQYFKKSFMTGLFERCGEIESIFFHKKPTSKELCDGDIKLVPFSSNQISGHMVSYVVFKESTSLKLAMNLHSEGVLTLTSPKNRINVGIKKWAKEYNANIPDVDNFLKEVEAYVANYDNEEEKVDLKTESIPDEDGWITVTKQSKRDKIHMSEAVNKKVLVKQIKERSDTTLLNFYRFQIREANSDQIAELRKKFQADKEKVALMKANRKFKPY